MSLKLAYVALFSPTLTYSTPQGRASLPLTYSTGLYKVYRLSEVYSWDII